MIQMHLVIFQSNYNNIPKKKYHVKICSKHGSSKAGGLVYRYHTTIFYLVLLLRRNTLARFQIIDKSIHNTSKNWSKSTNKVGKNSVQFPYSLKPNQDK